MPVLRVVTGPAGVPPGKSFRVFKKLTTVGRGADNDIVLADPQVQPSHAFLELSDQGCHIIAVGGELLVGGKRKSKSRLVPGDSVRIGATELVFAATAASDLPSTPGVVPSGPPSVPPPFAPRTEGGEQALIAYRKLHEFSERLFHRYDPSELLSELVDAVVDATGADSGFLVLLEDGRPRVRVARSRRKQTVADPDDKLSDSIVDKVLRTQQPVIVSDALRDAEFQNAVSVMHLRLSSVMCVPLRERGNLLGALYVGASGTVNLFRPSDLEVLTVLSAQAALLLRNAMLVSALKQDNRRLGEELEQMRVSSVIGIGGGGGFGPAMQDALRTVHKVAGTDVSVLITGETGTGKELIAKEIHRLSPRSQGPLVAINCGAIPEPLLESELFGHVKGAFTGAVASKPGRFQAAHGGTIFLDELGEMPLGLQVKLLRVLQERVVTRVGDTRPEPVDVRILAATHRELPQEIRAGRFREDLYYRLNVVQIHLPPLRERGEDILILAKYFLRRFAEELKVPLRALSPATELALRKHPWPGNIRQLENHIKKALVLSERTTLEPEDLGLSEQTGPRLLPLADARDRFVRDYVRDALALFSGHRARAAQALGVDERTIYRLIERDGKSDSGENGPA